jgi:proteasome assembly chaperone (PAC2) family protein
MAALGLKLDRRPELRDPALIAAFTGWNDGGEAASAAVRWLVRRLPGQRFASIDAEFYHNFSTTRPVVRINGGERQITWPSHDAFYHADPEKTRDLILIVAKEPEIQWRSYCDTVLELATSMGVTTLVTLGAYLGDAIHTRPVPISGFTTSPDMADRIVEAGVTPSNYDGPSGMTTLIHDFARQAGIPSFSLWAAVPHYLPTTANPKAALALVRSVAKILNLDLNLRRLEAAASYFQRQVDQAIANDRRAMGMLKALERRVDEEDEEGDESSPETPRSLPSAEEIIRDLESFLRTQEEDDEE